jgi:hypothetical protein
MGRTDATRVLAGFLDVFANMTSGAPLYQAEVLRRVFTALLAKTHKLDAKGAQQGSALVAGEYSFFNFF